MKKYVVMSVILGFLGLFAVNAFSAEAIAPEIGGPKEEAWRQAEEPKTAEAAKVLKDKAEKNLKEAEQRKAAAEREGKKELVEQEDLTIARERLDVNIADQAEVQFSMSDPTVAKNPEELEQQKERLKQLKQEQAAIETRVSGYSRSLNESFTPSASIAKNAKEWTTYYTGLSELVKNSGNKLSAIDEAIVDVYTNYSGEYDSQKAALEQILTVIQEQGKTAEYVDLSDEVSARISEINNTTFPQQVMTGNTVAKELKLDLMIPSDQIAALSRKVLDINRNETLSDEQKLKELRSTEAAVKFYALDRESPRIIQIIENMKVSLEARVEAEMPEGLTEADLAEGGVISDLVEKNDNLDVENFDEKTPAQKASMLDKIGRLLRMPGEKVQRSLVKFYEKASARLLKVGDKMGEIADALKEVPTLVKDVSEIAVGAEEVGIGSVLNGLLARIPNKDLRKVVEVITKVLKVVSIGDRTGLLTGIGKIVGASGKLLDGVAAATKWLGKKLAARTERGEYVMTQERIKEVDRLLKREKLKVVAEKMETADPNKFFENTKKTMYSWGTSIFDYYSVGATGLKAKEIQYEKARKDYLSYLGLDEKATAKQVKDALKKKAGITRVTDWEFKAKTKAFVDAGKALSAEFSSIAQKHESASATMIFLKKEWNGMSFNEKAESVDLMKSFFKMRDMKMRYLDQLQKGIRVFEDKFNTLAEVEGRPISEIARVYTDVMTRMVADESSTVLKDYDNAAAQIQNQINSMKKELKTQKTVPVQPSSGVPGGPPNFPGQGAPQGMPG